MQRVGFQMSSPLQASPQRAVHWGAPGTVLQGPLELLSAGLTSQVCRFTMCLN